MTPAPAPDAGTAASASSSSSRVVTATTSLTASARTALTGPSGPALLRGVLGSVLLTPGGFGTGALPVDGGPAARVGLIGFAFGHGEILALALTWTGVVLLVTAWLALGPRAVSGRLAPRDAVWATALWSLPLLPAVPLFSRDAWSYLAQGAMTAAGVDPYEFGPEANPGAFSVEVSPDWQSTATPYGPLHLLAMRILVALSGGHPGVGVLLLRLAVFAALGALVALVVTAARRTGVHPGAAVWMACMSPLSVIHLAGGLHNEIFPLVACLGAVVLTLASGTGLGWLNAISVSDRVINYLSAPTAAAHLIHAVTDSPGFEDVLAVTRRIGQVLLAATLVAVWWCHRRDRLTAVRGIMLALLAFVVLNSLAWPWYHLWVAAFWVLARPGRRATTVAVAVVVFLVMAIGPNGSTSLYSPVVTGIAVVASLATGWWWWRATAEG